MPSVLRSCSTVASAPGSQGPQGLDRAGGVVEVLGERVAGRRAHHDAEQGLDGVGPAVGDHVVDGRRGHRWPFVAGAEPSVNPVPALLVGRVCEHLDGRCANQRHRVVDRRHDHRNRVAFGPEAAPPPRREPWARVPARERGALHQTSPGRRTRPSPRSREPAGRGRSDELRASSRCPRAVIASTADSAKHPFAQGLSS